MNSAAIVRSICAATATAAVLAVLSISCSSAGREQSAAVQEGHALYVSNCSPCHEANNVLLRKRPPVLTGVFQRATLPSGATASDAQVQVTILQGRGIMPAFQGRLSDRQVKDIIAFLHTK
jgi:mono/diheme cytochrome c family protein